MVENMATTGVTIADTRRAFRVLMKFEHEMRETQTHEEDPGRQAVIAAGRVLAGLIVAREESKRG